MGQILSMKEDDKADGAILIWKKMIILVFEEKNRRIIFM